MGAQENAASARALYDGINAHDPEQGAAVIADEAEWTEVPTGALYHGPDGWRQNLGFWLGAFPDGQVEVTSLFADGDSVAVEYTGRGMNTGPIAMPDGEIPPTGRSVELQFCDIWEFKGGKVAGGRSYYDMASLMGQLGLSG